MLPYGKHLIDDEDVAAVIDVLRGDWLTTGPAVRAFEKALARRVDARYAVICSSGTAALHLSALALRLDSKASVVVPAVTFLATANAARYVGAEVVFSDVEPDTGLMSHSGLEQALQRTPQSKVRTILPVHLNGQCVITEDIRHLANRYGAHVIEDACHALGTTYRTASGEVATIGSCRDSDLAVFSFHPVKAIAMGEGGAVTTNDENLYKRLLLLRNHGITREVAEFENGDLAFDVQGNPNPWYYEMAEPGYNYRASDINCALGLSQLAKLDRYLEKRRRLTEHYDALLKPLAPAVCPIARTPNCNPAWHLYVVLIDFDAIGISRGELMRRLSSHGIGTQVHYLPLHLQPYYRRRYGRIELPGAETYYRRALSLPLFPGMDTADVDYVVDNLRSLIGA